MLKITTLAVAAIALAGCVRSDTVPNPVGASNQALGLLAETPEGCKVYVMAGGGTMQRIGVCPAGYSIAMGSRG